MANRDKKCSLSFTIREIHIMKTMRYLLIPIHGTIRKYYKKFVVDCVVKIELSPLLLGKFTGSTTMGNSMEVYQ